MERQSVGLTLPWITSVREGDTMSKAIDRVLVMGGRRYCDWATLCVTMNRLHEQHGITAVIHGGASGADRLAGLWARIKEVAVQVFPADWEKHGKAAGPIRNQQMLDEGRPDLVVAFPGGRGTSDMVARAKRAGVEVMMIEGATA